MTDFRARGTIMGPTSLTAVFGMGTGVTWLVWSPEMPPAGGQARRQRLVRCPHTQGQAAAPVAAQHPLCSRVDPKRPRDRCPEAFLGWRSDHPSAAAARGRSRRIGVVKQSAVGTGPLRRSPAVHSQPIDLVVFQEPSH